jgi:hypothetical protein
MAVVLDAAPDAFGPSTVIPAELAGAAS